MSEVLRLTMEAGVVHLEDFLTVWRDCLLRKCCPNGVVLLVCGQTLPLCSSKLCDSVACTVKDDIDRMFAILDVGCQTLDSRLAYLLAKNDFIEETIYVIQTLEIRDFIDLAEIVMANGRIEILDRIAQLSTDTSWSSELNRRVGWNRSISYVSDELYRKLKLWDGEITWYPTYSTTILGFLWQAIYYRSEIAINYLYEKIQSWSDKNQRIFYERKIDVLYRVEAEDWGYEKALRIVERFSFSKTLFLLYFHPPDSGVVPWLGVAVLRCVPVWIVGPSRSVLDFQLDSVGLKRLDCCRVRLSKKITLH